LRRRQHEKKIDSLPEDVILKIYSHLFNNQVRNVGKASQTMRNHAKTEFKVRRDWVKHMLKEPDAFTLDHMRRKSKNKSKNKSKSKSKTNQKANQKTNQKAKVNFYLFINICFFIYFIY
jgi:hypothetical protein